MAGNCSSSYASNLRSIYRNDFRIFEISAYSVVSVPATVLNFVIIYTIWKTRSLHRPSMTLILNLALADFFIGLIVCPMGAIGNTLLLKGEKDTWDTFWPVVIQFLFGVLITRLHFLMIISIDRFLAIKLKFRYKTIVSDKRVTFVARLAWFAALILSTLLSALSLNKEEFRLAKVFGAIWISLMLAVITVFSSMSFHKLKKLTSQTDVNQELPNDSSQFDVSKYRRTFNTMLLILFTILSFYVPVVISLGLRGIWRKYLIFRYLVRVGQWLVEVSSVVNPLVYLWRMKELRDAVKATFNRRTRTAPDETL